MEKAYIYKGVHDFYIGRMNFAKHGDTVIVDHSNVTNVSTGRSFRNLSEEALSLLLKDLVPFEEEEITDVEVVSDNVNHPEHYTKHPSGVECIDITEHYCFTIGNAIKYLWRAGLKQDLGISAKDKEIEDLKKAIWYINRRIKQLSE